MAAAQTKEHWNYVFTYPYSAQGVAVQAGQTVTIEFAKSTNNNGYIYFSKGNVLSPYSQRTNTAALKAGGTIIKEVLTDGTIYFGTNDSGSSYYMFNGEYIKVCIE